MDKAECLVREHAHRATPSGQKLSITQRAVPRYPARAVQHGSARHAENTHARGPTSYLPIQTNDSCSMRSRWRAANLPTGRTRGATKAPSVAQGTMSLRVPSVEELRALLLLSTICFARCPCNHSCTPRTFPGHFHLYAKT